MVKGSLVVAVAVTATLMTGCSSGKTTVVHSSGASSSGKSTSSSAAPTTTSEETSTEAAPVTPLDSSQCVDVTGANLDLLTSSDKEAARKAADTLEQYSPPSKVKAAIEHFVSVGGAHFDDPDYTKSNKLIKDWVEQVCPT